MRRFCLFVSMLVLAFIFGNSTVYLTNDAALKLAFPKNDKVIPKKVTFSAEQKKKICTLAKIDSSPGEFTYYTGVLKKKITGFAVIADTRSKLASFQFLLVVNLNGTIRSVEVMSYNEDIGSEITNKDFLVQYKNKSSNNKIKVKEDINNIAGATISCRNLTDSVRINLACLTVIAPIEKKAVPKPKKTASMSSYVIPLMTSVVKPYARARYLMGTLLELQVYADNSETANSAINAAFDETVRLEDIFSVYKPDSDASRVNTASNLPVKVSEDYIKLLSKCNEITQETNGAFDVTAAPLISIWKTAEIRNVMPTTEEIEKAKNSVGISKLIIDDNNKTVFSQTPGVKANFGGIAKGYALDKAAKILKEHGIKSALLNFGGQVLVIGLPPEQEFWTIDIRNPHDPWNINNRLAEVKLVAGSISTSADYARGLSIAGVPVSHIVDPRTGKSVNDMLSVTVVALTATEADAYSTGIYVMGLDNGKKISASKKMAVLIAPINGETYLSTEFQVLQQKMLTASK